MKGLYSNKGKGGEEHLHIQGERKSTMTSRVADRTPLPPASAARYGPPAPSHTNTHIKSRCRPRDEDEDGAGDGEGEVRLSDGNL